MEALQPSGRRKADEVVSKQKKYATIASFDYPETCQQHKVPYACGRGLHNETSAERQYGMPRDLVGQPFCEVQEKKSI